MALLVLVVLVILLVLLLKVHTRGLQKHHRRGHELDGFARGFARIGRVLKLTN